MSDNARKRLESSDSSGLSSISSESEDDFASFSELSSAESISSDEEEIEIKPTVKDREDSDGDSIEYLDARAAWDLIDFEDFNIIRCVVLLVSNKVALC